MMVRSKEYTMPSRAARLTAVCAAAPPIVYPWLLKEEFGTDHGGVERQSVIRRECIAQRDAERAIHAGEIAESGEDAGTADVARAQVIGGLAGPFAARYRIDARFFPGDPVLRLRMRHPRNHCRQNHP